MNRVSSNKKVLCKLCRCSKTKHNRSKHFRYVSNNAIRAIVDIVYNILRGNIHLKPKLKARLSKYKHEFRQLVRRDLSLKRSEAILFKKAVFFLS